MTEQLSGLFTWRGAIINSDLSPLTRHVLLTLSLHMSEAGDSCFPSITRLADETGLSRPTVIKHISVATLSGWISKKPMGLSGRGWKRNQYFSIIPNSFWWHIEAIVEGGQRGLPRQILEALTAWQHGEGGKAVLPRTKQRGKADSGRWLSSQHKVVNQVNPNSSYNTSSNNSAEKIKVIFCQRCLTKPYSVQINNEFVCVECAAQERQVSA